MVKRKDICQVRILSATR